MKRQLASATLLVTLIAPVAQAQRTFRTVGTDLKNAALDVVSVWTSPLRADTHDWLVFGGVAAGFAALLPFDDNIDRWVVAHGGGPGGRGTGPLAMLRPFREGVYIGGYRQLAVSRLVTGPRPTAIGGTLYLIGFIADNPDIRDAGLGCLASQQAITVVRGASYYILARKRPNAFLPGESRLANFIFGTRRGSTLLPRRKEYTHH